MGCLRLTYQKTTSKTESTPIFEMGGKQVSDYYLFGMQMPGRHGSDNSEGEYRYGFNGAERDDEVKNASGSHYDLGLRNYDTRVARMFSVDPRANEYPWQTSYAYHRNSPITMIDYLGGGDGEYKNEQGEVVYDDGVNDKEVHHVKNENIQPLLNDPASNFMYNFTPQQRKEQLAQYVDRTETSSDEDSNSQPVGSILSVKPPDFIATNDGGGYGDSNSSSSTGKAVVSVTGGIVGGANDLNKYGSKTVQYSQKVNGKVVSADNLTKLNHANAAKAAPVLKAVNRSVTGVSLFVATSEFVYSEKSASDVARLTGSVIITATAAIPIFGPVISLSLGVLDAYGAFDDIYNSFDE